MLKFEDVMDKCTGMTEIDWLDSFEGEVLELTLAISHHIQYMSVGGEERLSSPY